MAKSKSKTFPKGTDYGDIEDFIYLNIATENKRNDDRIRFKYLITITKLPDKDETPQQTPCDRQEHSARNTGRLSA